MATLRYPRFALSGLVLAVLATSLSNPLQAQVCPTLPGEVTDPVGDAFLLPGQTSPDMVSGSATRIGNSLRFRIRFAPGTFDPATTLVTINLDTDRNPSTGTPGISSDGKLDASIMGVEYIVSLYGTLYGSQSVLLKYTGPPTNTFSFVSLVPVTFFPDGMDATVSLAQLGKTDADVNFKFESSRQTGPRESTAILDIMPDVGLLPGTPTCQASASSSGPQIASGGVVNASTFAESYLAPGEIVTIFGAGLGPADLVSLALDSSGMVSTQLAGTRVLFDGIAAPLIYVRSDTISAVVPYEVAGHAKTDVVVQSQAGASAPVPLSVAATAPGLFTVDASGRGQLAALNEDGTVNSAANPALRGSIVVLYGTGEGQTTPAGVDGKPAVPPWPHPQAPVTVTIGGQDAEVIYAGAAPGLVAGALQVNVRIPASVVPGASVPVLLNAGSAVSLTAPTLAIR